MLSFLWRPNLRGEGDNYVLELAAARGASSIITHNNNRQRLAHMETTKMSTFTLRLSDDQHARLHTLAAHRCISLIKLFEEFSTRAVAEFDSEMRFRLLSVRGDAAIGLKLLDQLDGAFGAQT